MKLREMIIKNGLECENVCSLNEECTVISANYLYEKKVVSKYIFINLDYTQYKKYIVDTTQYRNNIEKIYLEPTFFDLVGDLSWNFYLVCVLPNEEYKKISSEELVKFEKNEKYARKLVINEIYFDRLIPVGKVVIGNSTNKIIDPIDDWNKELNENGMSFCLDAYSKEKLIGFLDNKNIEFNNCSEQTFTISEGKSYEYDKIKQINITEQFRTHCFGLNRKIEFTDVNLFFGANGSGKTSLLEAIELIMTGQIRKNNTGDIDNDFYNDDLSSSISLQMKNNNKIMYIPNDISERKSRESVYYQNRQGARQKEKLNKEFHQYNYYSFEDTFSFCFLGEQPNYNEEFSKIIYGESTKIIENNWMNYRDKFEQEKNTLEKDISCLINDVELVGLSNNGIIMIGLEPLYKLLEEVKVGFAKVEDETNVQSVLNWLIQINNKLVKIKMSLDNFLLESGDIDTKEEIQESLNKIKTDKDDLFLKKEIIEKDISNLTSNLYNLSNELNKYLKDYNLIKSKKEDIEKQIEIYEKFIEKAKDIDKCNLILELENNKDNLEKQVSLINYFKDTWKDIVNYQIDENIDDIKKKIEIEIKKKDELDKKYKGVCDKIRTEESKNKDIDNIIIKLKALGINYYNERIDNLNCPLCGSKFISEEKFLEAIETEFKLDDFKLKKLIDLKDTIIKDINLVGKNLNYYNTQRTYINSLNEAYRFILTNKLIEVNNCSSDECNKNMIQAVNSVFNSLEVRLQELRTIDNEICSLESEGYNCEYIKSVIEYINKLADTKNSKLTLETIAFVKNMLYEKLNKNMTDEQILQSTIEKLNELTQDETKKINEEEAKRQNFIVDLQALEKNFKKMSILKTFSEEIDENDIYIDNISSITKIRNFIITISDEVITFIDKVNKVIKQKEDEEKLLILKGKIKLKKKQRDNCLYAVKILDSLKRSSLYAEEFIKENINDISNLFISLHSPREFEKLALNGDGKIVGYRKINDNEVETPIYLMSSGQRTAVVISIFFKLHTSMKTVPRFILLDEPVSNIDDLNILSLLDFLREMAISNGTQIFFTTANYSVAKLFKRKFSFLRDNFNEFKFMRYGNTKTKIEKYTYNEFEDEKVNEVFI